MNKKTIIVIIILLTTSLLISIFVFKKNTMKQFIQSSKKEMSCDDIIKEADRTRKLLNYCKSDSDCLVMNGNGYFTFDCYYLVNKGADQALIKNLENSYNEKCQKIMFDCFDINPKTECKNNKCIEKVE